MPLVTGVKTCLPTWEILVNDRRDDNAGRHSDDTIVIEEAHARTRDLGSTIAATTPGGEL